MDRVSLVLILQRKRSSNTRQDLYLTLCHDPSLINVLLLPLQVLWGLHPSLSLQTGSFHEVKSAFINSIKW